MSTVAQLPGWWTYAYDPPAELNADVGGYSATISFLTTYKNLTAFILVVTGTPQTVSGGGITITRIIPLQHPLYSGLWAKKVRTKAFGTASTTSTALTDLWSHVEVIVDFGSVLYGTDGSSQPYYTVTTKGSGVYTTIPGRKMVFSNGEVMGQDAGQFSSQETYNVNLYQCPTLGDATLNGLLNKVNSTTFLGNAGGTVLFNSWDGDYSITTGGVFVYTKQLQFTWQSHPWNQFFRSDGTLDTPTDPASNPVYASVDLNQIFQS